MGGFIPMSAMASQDRWCIINGQPQVLGHRMDNMHGDALGKEVFGIK